MPRQAIELHPDVVILDIGLPSLDGIEAAKIIRDKCPESKVVFLTQNMGKDIMSAALAVGGTTYVLKMNAATQLLMTIEEALRDRR